MCKIMHMKDMPIDSSSKIGAANRKCICFEGFWRGDLMDIYIFFSSSRTQMSKDTKYTIAWFSPKS